MRPRRESPKRNQEGTGKGPGKVPEEGPDEDQKRRAQDTQKGQKLKSEKASPQVHESDTMELYMSNPICGITGVTPLARERPYKHRDHNRWLAPQEATGKHSVAMLQVLRHRTWK